MVDLSSPEDKRLARQAEREAKRSTAEMGEVVQSIMSTTLGRKWMLDKLTFCHVFQTVFKGENTHHSAFAEGERNIGLMLLSEIMSACPEAYIQMMGEQNAGRSPAWDRSDPDDDRNYSDSGDWIGTGPDPRDEDPSLN